MLTIPADLREDAFKVAERGALSELCDFGDGEDRLDDLVRLRAMAVAYLSIMRGDPPLASASVDVLASYCRMEIEWGEEAYDGSPDIANAEQARAVLAALTAP